MKIIINRRGKEYNEWRRMVFERDGYSCQHCGVMNVKFHPHHIVKWEDDALLRVCINNGITLCQSCHSKEHYRMGMIAGSKGKTRTDEVKKRISDSLQGRPG